MGFWILVALNEALGWILLIGFAAARYWYGRRRLSWWLLAAMACNELWMAPIALREMVVNERRGLIYVLEAVEPVVVVVAGGIWFRTVDRLAQRLIASARGAAQRQEVGFPRALAAALRQWAEQGRRAAGERKAAEKSGNVTPDLEHAKAEREGWYGHLLIFAIAWGALQLLLRVTPLEPVDLLFFGSDPERAADRLQGVRRVWLMILVADFFWSFSYSIWPRSKPVPAPQEPPEASPRPAAPHSR